MEKLKVFIIKRAKWCCEMLKIVLGMAIVAISTACGYIFSKKYRQRRCFMGQLREFNELFINEIAYYRRPIKDFLACHCYSGEFQLLLQDYLASLAEYPPQKSCFLDLSKYSFLQASEKTDIIDYFMMLGKGDSASQKSYFLSMRERLVKYETEAISQSKKYENLYIKLGFLCGLFILILIV